MAFLRLSITSIIVFLLSLGRVYSFIVGSNHLLPSSYSTLKTIQTSQLFTVVDEDIFDVIPSVRIEGNSLQTWSFDSTSKRIQVSCRSSGRPIEASIELWQTPSYIPTKFKVECEDGSENIVHSIIELSDGHPTTLAVYNTEGQEFPMDVSVQDRSHVDSAESIFSGHQSQYIEGNKAVKSYTFGYGVESVHVLLKTNTRNMKGM